MAGIYRIWIWWIAAVVFWPSAEYAFAQTSVMGAGGGAWVNATEYEYFHVVVPTDASGSMLDAAADFCRLWKTSTRHDIDFDNTASGRINVWIGTGHLPEDLASQLEGIALAEDLCYVKTYVPPPRYAARGATKQLVLAGDGELLRLTVRAFFREVLGVTWAAPGVITHPRAGYTIPAMSAPVRPAFVLRDVDPRLYNEAKADAEQVLEFRLGVGLPRVPLPVPPAPLKVPETPAPNETSRPVWGSSEAASDLADRIAALAKDPEGPARYQWPPGGGDWSLGRIRPDFSRPAEGDGGAARFANLLLQTACEAVRLLEQWSLAEPWRIRVELSEGVTAAAVPSQTSVRRVVVQLVPTHLDFFRDLNDRSVETNRQFRADLRAWRNAGIRVHVVLPVAGRAHPESLFPVFGALSGIMMALHEEGVEGVYLGDPWTEWTGGIPALASWRAYLAALLAFDSGLDSGVLSRRFCMAYYGATAAGAVLDALRMAEQDFRSTGRPLDLDDEGAWLTAATRDAVRKRLERARAELAEMEASRLDQFLGLFGLESRQTE